MATPDRKDRIDSDGVRIVAHRNHRRMNAGWMFAVLAAAGIAGVIFVRPQPRVAQTPAAPPSAVPHAKVQLPDNAAPSSAPTASSPSRARQFRAVHVDRSPLPPNNPQTNGQHANVDPEQAQQQQMEALARDMIDAAKQAGETKGLAAFPPPGTDPIKTGLVVPDDFELPEGYVRHYQITDDGRRLEPILMFSPDYQFVDEEGRPIPLPENGVVPPEMAPPGMPIRTLEMPKDPYGAGSGGH